MGDTNADSEDPGSPASRADREARFGESFADWLGITVEEVGDGEASLSVEDEEFKRNLGGVVHGGVTATLIDVAAAIAIRSALGSPDSPERRPMATTNLEVSYLRPVTDTAYATAEVVRIGSSNAVTRVDVESTAPDGERKTVAIATVTYQLP